MHSCGAFAMLRSLLLLAMAAATSIERGQPAAATQQPLRFSRGWYKAQDRIQAVFQLPNATQRAVIGAMHTNASRRLQAVLKNMWIQKQLVLYNASKKKWNTYEGFQAQAFQGSIKRERALELGAMIDLCRPQRILEIGSFVGLSSHFYLQATSSWGGRLTSIDPAIPHRVFQEPRVVYHRMNDYYGDRVQTIDAYWTRSWAHEASDNGVIGYERPTYSAKTFLDRGKRFDFVFIDGDHRTSSVWRDFREVVPLMRPHGCIAFDDVAECKANEAVCTAHAANAPRLAVQEIDDEIQRNNTGIVLTNREHEVGAAGGRAARATTAL